MSRCNPLPRVDFSYHHDPVVRVLTPQQAGFTRRLYGNCQVLKGASGSWYLQSYNTAVIGVVETPVGKIWCDLWGGWSSTTSQHISASYAFKPLHTFDKRARNGVFGYTRSFYHYCGHDPFREESWYDEDGNPYDNFYTALDDTVRIGRATFYDRGDNHESNFSFHLLETAGWIGAPKFTVFNLNWMRLKKYAGMNLVQTFDNKELAIQYGYMNHLDKQRFIEGRKILEKAA